jgi:hypothetical protein
MLFDPVPAGIRMAGEKFRLLHRRTAVSRDSTAVLSLTVVWLFVELLIHPAGEFPLNDDWSYTRSLQQWFDLHHYHLLGWTSMPLAAHLVWGMLFCKIFGFSFTVLRYSTVVLGCLGGIGAYFLSREFSENKAACFFTALLLLLNPIYLNLSNTFMTDVPFTSFLILSILFFVKGLRQDKLSYIFQGIFFILIATMIRQLGLLAAGAFSLALLIKNGPDKRSLILSVLATGVPLCVYFLYNHWLNAQHIYPVKYDEGLRRIQHNLFGTDHSTFKYLLRQALNIFVYAGFFTFPLIFRARWFPNWRKRRSPSFLICIVVMAGIGIYCLVHRNNIPLMGNIMNPFGIGPVELRDITVLRMDHIQKLPAIVWQLLCLVGIVGGGVLLWAMMNSIRHVQKNDRPLLWFLLCFAIAYCFVMLVGGTYDRYLIPLIPVLSVLMLTGLPEREPVDRGQATGKQAGRFVRLFSGHLDGRSSDRVAAGSSGRYAAAFFFLVGAWFSIAGTSNYLSWNRTRWNALRYLTYDNGVPPSRIDGGFEFNGYYNYNDEDISGLKEKADPTKKSWWWVKDDTYMVTFGPVEGYTVLKTFPCRRTLLPFFSSSENVFVLKKSL